MRLQLSVALLFCAAAGAAGNAVPTIEESLSTKSVAGAQISPDGRYVAYTVTQANWDAHAARWMLRTSRGDLTADVLISAAGPLSEPSLPDVPGLASFAGEVFHSARWNYGYDLTGHRIEAVVVGRDGDVVTGLDPVGFVVVGRARRCRGACLRDLQRLVGAHVAAPAVAHRDCLGARDARDRSARDCAATRLQ